MSERKYIGARYVPLFADPLQWDNTRAYEPLTIVLNGGNSYTSRQYVPIGIDIANSDYWALSADYNAAIQNIDNIIPTSEFSSANTVKDYIDDGLSAVDAEIDALAAKLPDTDFTSTNTVKDYIDDGLSVEALASVRAFDTVADMQAATDLENGMVCHTNGFHASGDGGAAYYTISESGTADGINVIGIPENNPSLYANFVQTTGIVSIDAYAGETNEDKLFTALDSVTSGTILCGVVSITKVYNALAKDYRNITIIGATFNLTIDEWFNQANSTYNSVLQFDSCVINGNGHTIFSGQNNAIGMRFNNCTLNNVTAYSSANHYVQSPYFDGCTMFNVGNLITATIAYDFKMIGCRVEAAVTGKLIKLTDDSAIRQGAVSNCLIEGRGDVVFEIGGAIDFVIQNCYFEALTNGLLTQTASNGNALIVVEDCAFFAPMANADYAITIASSGYANTLIRRNRANLPSGKYLCNKSFQTPSALSSMTSVANINYGNAFSNNGFPAYQGRLTPVQNGYKTNAVWDSDNSAWKIKFMLDYEQAYLGLHPIYIVFQASYASSTQYAGFAIVRLTPRTAYNGSGIVTVCDATVVDACNSNSMNKTWSGSVSVELSANTATNPSIVYTVSINGFNNTRTPRYRVIDPWYIVGLYNIPAE